MLAEVSECGELCSNCPYSGNCSVEDQKMAKISMALEIEDA